MADNYTLYDYVREEAFPTIWCPGCGYGIILKAAQQAMANLKLDKNDIMAVCGIGCSSRAASYCDVNSVQTTHGRAIPFATGSKMIRSDMHHILFLGDGDCAAIGGNHFLHAARRNLDLTVIIMNNSIYAMTGGQLSPTTPKNKITTTSTLGNLEQPLDVCSVSMAAGASFVARTTAFHYAHMVNMIQKAIAHKGFSVVECVTPCPTNYGRRNKYASVIDMYKELRDNYAPVGKAAEGQTAIGVLCEKDIPELSEQYKEMSKVAVSRKKQRDYIVPEQIRKNSIERCEIRLTGSGGQGLITGGIMLAEAGIRQGSQCVQTQTYGPESRGGASCAEVVISDEEIYYPEVQKPDILLAMTQQAFDKYISTVKSSGMVIADSTYVHVTSENTAKLYEYPITAKTIEKLGSPLCANVVAIAIISALSGIVDKEALRESVLARAPAKYREMNSEAITLGYEISDCMFQGEKE